MRVNRLFLTLFLLLLSCDAGTLEVKIATINVGVAPLDSISLDIKDTLYLYLQKSNYLLLNNWEEEKTVIKFLKNAKRPVVKKDTVFLNDSATLLIPSRIKLIVNSTGAKVNIRGVNLLKGNFQNSNVVFFTDCTGGPFNIKKSSVEFRIPRLCNVKFQPENKVHLKSKISAVSIKVLKFKVDSAKFYLETGGAQ